VAVVIAGAQRASGKVCLGRLAEFPKRILAATSDKLVTHF